MHATDNSSVVTAIALTITILSEMSGRFFPSLPNVRPAQLVFLATVTLSVHRKPNIDVP